MEGFYDIIRRVEIEIHSLCNRKCEWCSNSIYDRSFKKDMPEEIFIKIINELKANDFSEASRRFRGLSGYISFSGFCEPMADINLLVNRVDKIRDTIPKTNLIVATNGDYVTLDKIKELQIDNLLISDYDCKGYDYALEFLRSLNCIIIRDDKNGVIYSSNKYISNIRYQYDWPIHSKINDLAGSLKQDVYYNGQVISWRNSRCMRQEKCIESDWYMSVDYMGNIFPCSYMRYEMPEHREYILGNINEISLYDIKSTNRWREMHHMFDNPTEIPDICKHCNKSRKQNSQEGILYEDMFF